MVMLVRIISHNNRFCVNHVRFKMPKHIVLKVSVRNAIIPDQGIGEYKNLAFIGRISHGLRISHHACGKDDFARNVFLKSKRLSGVDTPILKNQRRVH